MPFKVAVCTEFVVMKRTVSANREWDANLEAIRYWIDYDGIVGLSRLAVHVNF